MIIQPYSRAPKPNETIAQNYKKQLSSQMSWDLSLQLQFYSIKVHICFYESCLLFTFVVLLTLSGT